MPKFNVKCKFDKKFRYTVLCSCYLFKNRHIHFRHFKTGIINRHLKIYKHFFFSVFWNRKSLFQNGNAKNKISCSLPRTVGPPIRSLHDLGPTRNRGLAIFHSQDLGGPDFLFLSRAGPGLYSFKRSAIWGLDHYIPLFLLLLKIGNFWLYVIK